MQQSILSKKVNRVDVVEVTPFRSLVSSIEDGRVITEVSSGLVRLTSATGELSNNNWNHVPEQSESKPIWRTLKVRAKASFSTEVLA